MSKKREEPRLNVTRTKPVGELDAQAQLDAKRKQAMFRDERVYVFHDGPPNAGRDICSVNGPIAGDTRDWHVVTFPEGDLP